MTDDTHDTDDADDRDATERTASALPTPSRRAVLGGIATAGVLGAGASVGAGRRGRSRADERCEAWDEFEVADGRFLLLNNQWSDTGADSCVFLREDGRYGWNWSHDAGGGPNYPEVMLGTKPWGTATETSLFPVQLGDVDELEVSLDVGVDVTTGDDWNLALEWWLLDERPEADVNRGDAITHEIMTVFDKGDAHGHGRLIEERAFTDAYGTSFDYWTMYDWDWNYHVFKTSDGTVPDRVDFTAHLAYLREAVDDSVGFGDDLWMSGLELGSEYWPPSAGETTIRSYAATLNGTTVASVDGGDGGGGEEDTTAPPTPTATVRATTPDSVTVGWESVDDAESGLDGYRVTVDGGDPTTAAVGTTETTRSGLDPATTYDIDVAAVDAAGNVSDPSTVTATTDEADDGDGGDDERLVVNDFAEWPRQNALGHWTGAGAFERSGVDDDGRLRLAYDDSGWFASNVRQSVADFTRLEIDVRGDDGGEETEIQLEVGGVEDSLAALADGTIGTSTSTLAVDLRDAGVDTSMVDDVRLNFFQGGAGAVEVSGIRFAAGDAGDATPPGTPAPVTAGDPTETGVDLSWSAVADEGGSGLAHYHVAVDGTRVETVPAGTTETAVSGLDPDTGYEFAVVAVDAAGNDSEAATVTARTDPEDTGDGDALVVNDYDGEPAWPEGNDLGNWNGAGSFANGGGDGAVRDEALVLEYDNSGWLVEQVFQDVSEYDSLVLRVAGDDGGEETDFTLELGGAGGLLADLTDDRIGPSYGEVAVDLDDVGVDPSAPGELRLNFWQGGAGTVRVDEIGFE